MLHPTPRLTSTTRTQLQQLDELHAELAHEIGRAARWDGTLRRNAQAAAVVASISIEGYAVSAAEVAQLAAGTTQPAADDPDRGAAACYARAMEHVHVLADDPSFRWLDRVLLDLHFDACVFQRDRSPGRWRAGPIAVSAPRDGHVYQAPDADEVAPLVDELLAWLAGPAGEEHLIVRAAMAHLHLVSIHPFRDGNGRLSRILQSLVLARGGVLAPEFASIEPYLAAHTADYYRELQHAQGSTFDPSRSAGRWVEFCIAAHLHQAREFGRRLATAAARWRALEELVSGRGWPDRLVIALEHACSAQGLTRAGYALEAGVAAPTATLDLRRVMDAGLVTSRGGGRSTSYAASAELQRIVGR